MEERSTALALKNDRFNSAHRDPSHNVLQLAGRSVFRKSEAAPVKGSDCATSACSGAPHVLPNRGFWLAASR